MDEADRLCDRIAIVDHGKLVALDSPIALKASVPGSNVIEAQFNNAPADWQQQLEKLEDVTRCSRRPATCYRILTSNGSKTTTELVELAVRSNVELKSLSVQNTTLDDVFVHYTGRQLRDEQVKAYQLRHARPSGDAPMNRMWAIVERELRKFFRSPTLMLVSMVFPLVQLIVLGNAFGGKIKDARLGVVDQDGGTQAVKVREALAAVQSNAHTFYPVPYDNDQQAMEDVRTGSSTAPSSFRREYSRRVYEENHPRIALIVDNTDNFMSSTLEAMFTDLTKALNNPDVEPSRILQQIIARYGGAVSLYRVHEVPAAGLDRAGHVRVGDDRRRHAVHRRQGARRARRLPGHAHHQVRTGRRAEHRGRDQGHPRGRGDHCARFPALRTGHAVSAAEHHSRVPADRGRPRWPSTP